MNEPLLAKSYPKESIRMHTNLLLRQLAVLQSIYPAIPVNWELLKLVCEYHDIGKANTKFQNKLREKREESLLVDTLPNDPEIPHGYLSCAFLPFEEMEDRFHENDLRVLYQSIYFHHKRPLFEEKEIEKIIEHDLPQYVPFLQKEGWEEICLSDDFFDFVCKSEWIPQESDAKETYQSYVLTKGLLNRIDYAASAHIDVEKKNEWLYETTLSFMERKGFRPNDLQEYLKNHSEENNVVIASTGIGKTEGALLWIGNHKGFFTLPLKVSINAIYNRLIKTIGFQSTGLLHSDISSQYLKYAEEEGKGLDLTYITRTKQFTLPLTICTLDQIIDFVFLYRGFEMKLATLAYSKVVIDEIQMYSPELVGLLLVGLKQIVDMGGKFTILTATFPPVFKHFMGKSFLNIPFTEAPTPFIKKNKDGSEILRHKIKVIAKDIDVEDILSDYHDKKVLVIVNTVKQAQQMYRQLKERVTAGTEVKLLHSRFTAGDRRVKEDDILEMGQLSCSKTGIWVTTQIVEASVDIDFDVLYTELSEVCGLFQRMGRVFRNRELVSEKTNVFVYSGYEFTSGINYNEESIVDPVIFQFSKEEIHKYDDTVLDERTKMEIVDIVYDTDRLKQEGSRYYRKIKETILVLKELKAYEIEKRPDIRNITNETILPYCLYQKNQPYIETQLDILWDPNSSVSDKIKAKDRIKDYTVSIPEWAFDKAKKKDLIKKEIQMDSYQKIPVVAFQYDSEIGLVFVQDGL